VETSFSPPPRGQILSREWWIADRWHGKRTRSKELHGHARGKMRNIEAGADSSEVPGNSNLENWPVRKAARRAPRNLQTPSETPEGGKDDTRGDRKFRGWEETSAKLECYMKSYVKQRGEIRKAFWRTEEWRMRTCGNREDYNCRSKSGRIVKGWGSSGRQEAWEITERKWC